MCRYTKVHITNKIKRNRETETTRQRLKAIKKARQAWAQIDTERQGIEMQRFKEMKSTKKINRDSEKKANRETTRRKNNRETSTRTRKPTERQRCRDKCTERRRDRERFRKN